MCVCVGWGEGGGCILNCFMLGIGTIDSGITLAALAEESLAKAWKGHLSLSKDVGYLYTHAAFSDIYPNHTWDRHSPPTQSTVSSIDTVHHQYLIQWFWTQVLCAYMYKWRKWGCKWAMLSTLQLRKLMELCRFLGVWRHNGSTRVILVMKTLKDEWYNVYQCHCHYNRRYCPHNRSWLAFLP